MSRAIVTKYLSATNTKGSRIKATVPNTNWSVTVPYDHSYSYEMVHFEAVKALVAKYSLNWIFTPLRCASLDHGDSYVFLSAGMTDTATGKVYEHGQIVTA
jgi:hypothetical protein